ncbi:TonB-dependent receptor domain-containing protein [Wenyingzhuangia sp. IMCC45533]
MRYLILIVLFTQIGFTQTREYFITGAVQSKETNESIPFVTVTVQNKQQSKSTIADENGKFVIEKLKYKEYLLLIEAIGYKTYRRPIRFENNNYLDLKTISLDEEAQALDAVVIRAETSSIKQKIDRVVISVGKDLTSVGTDAASVLNNVQSVSVDQQTGELSLRGNTNVKVLIDGKPTNIPTDQLLQQLPANAIKNIELITNPSAKYNPEGNSGIINIELVKNTNTGFNGTANTSTTFGRNVRGNHGLNLNFKKENINWYANYSFRGGKSDILGSLTRPNNVQETFGVNDRKNQLLKLGADVDLNKKTSISLFTIQNFNRLKYTNTTEINTLPERDLINNSVFFIDRSPRNQTYDASLHHYFDKKKHTLDFGITFNTRKSPEESTTEDFVNPSDLTNNFEEDINEKSQRVLINLDYSKPINENISLEMGLEYRTFDQEKLNNSTQRTESNDLIGLSDFEFDRDIYSAYFSYRHQINQLGLQIGLRAESYNLDASFFSELENKTTPVEDKKNSLYPSVFLTYQLSSKNQLQASYSRRVDRPSPKQLTPIRTWGTPLLTSRGNPDLEQQFTNSFELKYNRDLSNGNFSITGFYRIINNFISRSLSRDALLTERIILSYDNFDTTDNYGLELAAYLKFNKWWRLNGSTDIYLQNQQGIVNNIPVEVQNTLFNFRVSNTLKLTDKLNFQITNLYRGRDKNVQRERQAMFLMNLGSSYKVLNNNGTVSINFSDVFNTFRARFNVENPIEQKGVFNWESQNVSIGFTYNFGKKFKTRKKRRPSEDREVGGDVF